MRHYCKSFTWTTLCSPHKHPKVLYDSILPVVYIILSESQKNTATHSYRLAKSNSNYWDHRSPHDVTQQKAERQVMGLEVMLGGRREDGCWSQPRLQHPCRRRLDGLTAQVSTGPASCSWEAPLAGTANQVAKQASLIAACHMDQGSSNTGCFSI